jgi:hypothetical protein
MKRLLLAVVCCLPLLTLVHPAQSRATAGLLETVQSRDWALEVRGVERRVDPLPAVDGADVVRANGRFVVLLIDLTNRSDRTLTPDATDFLLHANDDRSSLNFASVPAARELAIDKGYLPFGDPIAPGATTQTILLFDINPFAGLLTLDFLPASTTVRIDECHCNLPSPVREVTSFDVAN